MRVRRDLLELILEDGIVMKRRFQVLAPTNCLILVKSKILSTSSPLIALKSTRVLMLNLLLVRRIQELENMKHNIIGQSKTKSSKVVLPITLCYLLVKIIKVEALQSRFHLVLVLLTNEVSAQTS